MFYRHLKKIALALTSFFWAGCDDSGSSAVCLYGPDPNYSSAAENPASSSSEATKEIPSSSEMQQAIALYGVPADFKSITLCVPGILLLEFAHGRDVFVHLRDRHAHMRIALFFFMIMVPFKIFDWIYVCLVYLYL